MAKRSGLSGRLERIRAGKTSSPAGMVEAIPEVETGLDATGADGSMLTGWTAHDGQYYEKESRVALDFGPVKAFSPHLPLLFPSQRDMLLHCNDFELSKRLVFFDLETTGLSHGSGTVAFMAAVGKLEDGGAVLTVHQLILADYPGEPYFLERLEALIGKDPILVSFNGKCFDSQILVTRNLMNGLRPSYLSSSILHLDLLHPSRRLWKRKLESCRLQTIEAAMLGVVREDDLPGSEAPEAWFSWLKTGDNGNLLRIGEHNLIDCVSLARLLFRLDSAIEAAEGRAALIRALALRSEKKYAEAASFLKDCVLEGDPLALRLSAVDNEHRLGDLEEALRCAEALGDEKRAARLVSKISKLNAQGDFSEHG